MFKICTLCSSSKGNCSFITDGETNILVDCGIKLEKLNQFLEENGYTLNDIDAVLITHEHIDHIFGLKALVKKVQPKIYAYNTIRQYIDERLGVKIEYSPIDMTNGFYIGKIFTIPFRTSHDSIYPLGYTFSEGGKRISVATDLGIVTTDIKDALYMSDMAILEANHDKRMLLQGRYPDNLKRRVSGARGHLSNDDSGKLIAELVANRLRGVILAHLSEENNLPELAYTEVEKYLPSRDSKVIIEVAPRDRASKFLEV